MAENEVKNPDLFNRSPGSQNLVEYFIKKKDSRISTRCLAVVNEEALAEFCRVVTLRSIKVDPYCEADKDISQMKLIIKSSALPEGPLELFIGGASTRYTDG